jgi:hypothetical protein
MNGEGFDCKRPSPGYTKLLPCQRRRQGKGTRNSDEPVLKIIQRERTPEIEQKKHTNTALNRLVEPIRQYQITHKASLGTHIVKAYHFQEKTYERGSRVT